MAVEGYSIQCRCPIALNPRHYVSSDRVLWRGAYTLNRSFFSGLHPRILNTKFVNPIDHKRNYNVDNIWSMSLSLVVYET